MTTVTQTQHRILLVDDEPNLRKVLGALLRQQGYEVHAEVDGAAALARVRSAPPRTARQRCGTASGFIMPKAR